jgi:hypothetical protein
MSNIVQHIKHLAKQSAGDGLQICIVKSVDEAKSMCECEPINGGAPYFARLRALVEAEDKSPLLVPVKDSVVIVATFNKNSAEAFVLGYTEVEKVKILTSKGEVWLNGDNFGGVVKIKEVTAKLNALENAHNALVAKFNSHTHLVATTGSAAAQSGTASPTTQTSTDTLQPTQQKDIENKKVKHGDK